MPASPNPAFAEAFERLRLGRGWTPAEVARRLDVYPTEVSRWRRGLGISIKNVRKIADLFGVERAWLEGLAGYDDGRNDVAAPATVTAKRQSIQAQLDSWLSAVGPQHEDYFWNSLKAHGDSAVDMIRQISTAINEPGHGAVKPAVSGQIEPRRKRRGSNEPPLSMRHRLESSMASLLASVVPPSNQLVPA